LNPNDCTATGACHREIRAGGLKIDHNRAQQIVRAPVTPTEPVAVLSVVTAHGAVTKVVVPLTATYSPLPPIWRHTPSAVTLRVPLPHDELVLNENVASHRSRVSHAQSVHARSSLRLVPVTCRSG
jgi:hypothetical protein